MELTATKYKETEVGLIPEDWEVKTLGELAEFYKGRGLSKSEIIQEGKYKCLHYGELFTKYKEEIITILSKTNTSENVFFSKSNDVLMPTSDVTPNGLATASCIREDNVILGGDVLVIRISNQIINGTFLSYYITQNRKQVMQLVSGSTVYHLYGSDMSKFVLSYPKIEEQNLIVQVLTDMDALIQALEKKIIKKKYIKKGVMQKLLTPNEDWEVKTLGELAEFYKGRGLSKSEIIQEGKYKCLHYGELFTKYKEEIITILSKTNTSENVFFSKSNDVLMPTSDVTPNGLATASCIREDNVILGGDVLVIRISNQIINGTFLSYYITQNRKQVMQLVSGSTVYHLYGSDMSKFVLSYPKIEEQNLIVQTLSDMDKEISHLEKKLSKYQVAKQGMIQQLLTGKIRLV